MHIVYKYITWIMLSRGRGGWREIWWPSTLLVACGYRYGVSSLTLPDGGAGVGAGEMHGVDPRSMCHNGNASLFTLGFIFDSESRFGLWCALG